MCDDYTLKWTKTDNIIIGILLIILVTVIVLSFSDIAELKQQYESIRNQLEMSGGELNVVLSRLTRIHDRRLELLRNFPDAVPEFGSLKSQFRMYAQQVNALTEKVSKIYERIGPARV